MSAAVSSFRTEDTRPVKIFFEDEAIFGRICQPVRSWSPKNTRPIVPKQIVREFLYVYTAAAPADGDSFSLILPEVNTDSMSLFLHEFSKYYADYKLVLVMDQAGWHKAKKLETFDNIRILDLPPYSPELNPIEHVWEYIRENHFHNRLCNSLSEVEEKLTLSLSELNTNKNTLQSLIGFNWTIFYV